MLHTLLLAVALSVAHADPKVDLVQAADSEAPESARMAAFDRLVRQGATDLAHIQAVATADDADTRQRWVAIRALGMIRGDGPRQTLLTLLDDEQPAIRAAAVQALGDLGDRKTATVIAAKLRDPAVIVRAGAAEALGKIRDQGTVQALSDAVMARDNYYRGSSLWVRRHYVASLGEIGSRDAVPTLLRTLDDADEGVRSASVKALESVAGFSYADGRDMDQQREAWRRWAQAQLR